MSRNLLIFLIIFVSVLAVALYIYTNNTDYLKGQTQSQTSTSSTPTQQTPVATPTEQEKSSNKTVEILSNRVAPTLIEVKKGVTIIWVNKDTKAHRIASNPHPIHNDYPIFDSLKNLEESQSYSFTFEKIGVWGYHDHLNPNIEGKVSVRE